MLQPYIVVEETETHTTYEYNTTCTYWLYSMIALLVVDVLVPTNWLIWVFTVLMGAYLVVVLIPATLTANRFRKAMKYGKIGMTGSRWSVTSPLRITVPKPPKASE
jgi:hypothetical protein